MGMYKGLWDSGIESVSDIGEQYIAEGSEHVLEARLPKLIDSDVSMCCLKKLPCDEDHFDGECNKCMFSSNAQARKVLIEFLKALLEKE